jgi:hypothetical protein
MLLYFIKTGKSISTLNDMGLEYFQVFELITQARKEGLVSFDGETFALSEEGMALLKENSDAILSPILISPLEEYKTSKLNKDDIYIPYIKKY